MIRSYLINPIRGGVIDSSNFKNYFIVFLGITFSLALIKYPLNNLLEGNRIIWTKDELIKLPIWELILSGVIFAPILEEISFRLAQSFRLVHVLIGLIGLVVFFNIADLLLVKILIVFLGAFTIVVYVFKAKNNDLIKGYIIISSIIFGFTHLQNYEYNNVLFLYVLSPIITLAQTALGLFCSYIRDYNFIFALLLHVTYNLLLVILYVIFEA